MDAPHSTVSMMLAPSNDQVTSVMAANSVGNGNLIVAPSANGAGVTAPNRIEYSARSKTRSGRNGTKRGLPGREFEPNLEKVQQRLTIEGGDAGAIECLRNDIFLDGAITKAALKAGMTLDQRRSREGTQKYMLLLKVVRRPQSSEKDHQCLLCPSWEPVEFKNREDSLRHFHKEHFGLSFDCSDWYVDF